jgi:hypothetical protein
MGVEHSVKHHNRTGIFQIQPELSKEASGGNAETSALSAQLSAHSAEHDFAAFRSMFGTRSPNR